MSEPQVLRDALSAVFCAAPRSDDPSELCPLLAGHDGDCHPANGAHLWDCTVWTTLRSPCNCAAEEQR